MNGTPLAGLWADAVAGVCVAAAVAAPAATHAARLDPAAPTLVADADQASLTPTRLTAAARLVAERHVAASRAPPPPRATSPRRRPPPRRTPEVTAPPPPPPP